MPQIDNLKKVLCSKTDDKDYVLILKTDGKFELVCGGGSSVIEDRNDVVSKFDTLDAGNDYVGANAANDEYFLSIIMDWANKVWSIFSQTRQINIPNYDS